MTYSNIYNMLVEILGYAIISHIPFASTNYDLDVKNFRNWGGIGLGHEACGKENKVLFDDTLKKVPNFNPPSLTAQGKEKQLLFSPLQVFFYPFWTMDLKPIFKGMENFKQVLSVSYTSTYSFLSKLSLWQL